MLGADAAGGVDSRRRRLSPAVTPPAWHAALVVGAVLVVYANALGNAFLWDDLHLVVANPAIKSWEAVPHLFRSDLFPSGIASGYYRPLQALTYALDYRLFGLAPFGFHLTSVLLHAATAVLLQRFGAVLLGSAAAALVGALLFAVHPLHVEAVTYVAGRSDPLAAVCMLAAVLAFRAGGRRGRFAAALAFLLALLAREAAVVLPLLLVVVDRAEPDRERQPWVAYLPMLAALVLYLGLRAAVLAPTGVTPATAAVPLGLRLLTTCEVIVRYLGLITLPRHLHMERVVAPVTSLLEPGALAALAALLALVVGCVWARRRAWPLAFGVTWFLVALLPVANLVPLATFMAEHWLYVPSMGLCLALGWGTVRLARGPWRPAVLLGAALTIAAYGAVTVRYNREWRDARTLYEYLLPLAPESLRVRINLAEAYQQAGEPERARRLYEETVRGHPDRIETADAQNNLGNLERAAGRVPEALAAFDRALAINPRQVAARNGRALALQALGRVDEAERELATALAIAPDSATTHSNLGNLYFRRDDLARAREHYLIAVRLDPDHADAHNNLGSTYFRLGDRRLAEHEYRTALRLNPASDGAHRNLKVLLESAPR